jgi:tRNA(fMet)-specific endonuclease VapC
MPGKALLDTNVVIAYRAGEATILDEVDDLDETFVPAPAVGELVFGALKSGRIERNLAWLDGFLATVTVLSCDEVTARVYGQIRDRLRLLGKPIPENDIWIAAIARQHGLPLATRDAHFSSVEGLAVAAW